MTDITYVWTSQGCLIHHSDCGSHYCSKAYCAVLDKYNIISSISRKSNYYNNACIESFHRGIKKNGFSLRNIVLEHKLK